MEEHGTAKQLVVISGKGGTGKTSITASLLYLAHKRFGKIVAVDADVDAADLHILLQPEVLHHEVFESGEEAVIDPDKCINCGLCFESCRFDAILEPDGDSRLTYEVDPLSCEGCRVCAHVCPADAIEMKIAKAGEWMVSNTKFGPFVHARLYPAAENSGKLVALIRDKGKEIAKEQSLPLVIIDGSPGVGCPVMSSLTGADLALVIAEPTPSGRHDTLRVLELLAQFKIPAMVAVNKFDLNRDLSNDIKQAVMERGARFAGEVPFDRSVVDALVQARIAAEAASGPAVEAIESIWNSVYEFLFEQE